MLNIIKNCTGAMYAVFDEYMKREADGKPEVQYIELDLGTAIFKVEIRPKKEKGE